MQYQKYYTLMADGTIKQLNPFTDTEVWSVPGRSGKPAQREVSADTRPLTEADFTTYCSFCDERLLETPPEKSRLIIDDEGNYSELSQVLPEHYHDSRWAFRRVPNLFEIVTVDYWKRNYAYALSKENAAWKERYLASEIGRKHTIDVLEYKLRKVGYTDERLSALSESEKFTMADAFFGGGHELVIANPHFRNNATNTSELFSTSDMTPEEHFEYIKFTVSAMTSIFDSNHYIRYISVFQNWLSPAGASFDHLHKQLVGLDDWGASIRHQIEMLRQDPNIYNQYAANLAAMLNLIIAENDSGIAFVGIGHRHPTIEIFSKSYFSRPYEHSDEEIRGMSDLIHACHTATGAEISCNEEWYYTPIDAIYKMPWHVLIKWRINTVAGFEGGTSIFINPIAPLDLRDRVVPRLYALREQGKITDNIRIAEECRIYPNPLRYYLQ